jgi:putative tryptophan/tyrosine transport system substrate-binding protein
MTVTIGRRELLAALSGAAAWPLAALAQQAGKLQTIGVLGSSTPAAQGQWWAAFVERLRELGWIEGRSVAIEVRWAEGRSERMAEIAAEFVRRKIDVIATAGTPATLAAKQATAVIPIVFVAVGEPVAANLVASLARPGGNITGLSNQAYDLGAKRLELLREVIPGLRRLAIVANFDNPGAMLEVREVQAAAHTLSLEVVTFEIRRPEDIALAFGALKGRADAIHVVSDALINTYWTRIIALALSARLPTISTYRENVKAGGMISYGPNTTGLYRRAAEMVDKILRGTKPSDIPVEQPTTFDLVINVTTAKTLGLTIPATLLARADEVIE